MESQSNKTPGIVQAKFAPNNYNAPLDPEAMGEAVMGIEATPNTKRTGDKNGGNGENLD